jgi:hypothetical protein
MTTTDQTPQHDLELNVDEGRYYPPESEVGPDGHGGIVELEVTQASVMTAAREGLVTLSFGVPAIDPSSYEFDLTPEDASRFAVALLAAADAVGRSGPPA